MVLDLISKPELQSFPLPKTAFFSLCQTKLWKPSQYKSKMFKCFGTLFWIVMWRGKNHFALCHSFYICGWKINVCWTIMLVLIYHSFYMAKAQHKEFKLVTSYSSFIKLEETRQYKGQLCLSWLGSYPFCHIMLLTVNTKRANIYC